MPRHKLVDSRNKNYSDQQTMVANIGSGYSLPLDLEVATGLLLHYARTQERLLNSDPRN